MRNTIAFIFFILVTVNMWADFGNPYENRKLTETPYHKIVDIRAHNKGFLMTTDDGLSWFINQPLDCDIASKEFRVGDSLVTYHSDSLFGNGKKWHYNPRLNLYVYSSNPRETSPGSCRNRVSSIDSENVAMSVKNRDGSYSYFSLYVPRPDETPETTEKNLDEIRKQLRRWKSGDPVALISNRSLSFGEDYPNRWTLENCKKKEKKEYFFEENREYLSAVRVK